MSLSKTTIGDYELRPVWGEPWKCVKPRGSRKVLGIIEETYPGDYCYLILESGKLQEGFHDLRDAFAALVVELQAEESVAADRMAEYRLIVENTEPLYLAWQESGLSLDAFIESGDSWPWWRVGHASTQQPMEGRNDMKIKGYELSKGSSPSASDIVASYLNGNIGWTVTTLMSLSPDITATVVLSLDTDSAYRLQRTMENRRLSMEHDLADAGDPKQSKP